MRVDGVDSFVRENAPRQKGHLGNLEIIDSGVPVELLDAMMLADWIRVPCAAEMLVLQAARAFTPDLLPQMYSIGAATLSKLPRSNHIDESRILRAAIARAELGALPPLPSGRRGLALLGLEAVANAISCWNLMVNGAPIHMYAGKVFTQPGGVGKRLRVVWPDGSKSPLGPPSDLTISLECGLLLSVPAWFLETRNLPYPFGTEAVEKCTRAASLALREYLWRMVGWNTGRSAYGEPIGGSVIRKALEWTADEESRVEGDGRVKTRGGIVEQLHKETWGEFKHLKTIIPERYPFRLFERDPLHERLTQKSL